MDNIILERKHELLELEPINVRFHNRLIKLWKRFEEVEPELYNESMNETRRGGRDHAWWGRAAQYYAADPPTPRYVQRQN